MSCKIAILDMFEPNTISQTSKMLKNQPLLINVNLSFLKKRQNQHRYYAIFMEQLLEKVGNIRDKKRT